MWDALFAATNGIAVLGWAALILLPRGPIVRSAVTYAGVGLLCLVYTIILGLLVSGSVDPGRDAASGVAGPLIYSVDGLINQFQSRGVLVLGWTHYLAFDLFVGLWIASDADNKGYSRFVQVPFLLSTYFAGPVGLLAWFAVRERRARASARAAGIRG